MNLELLKAPFPEDEIEWRIGKSGKKGNSQIYATCLAYTTGRGILNRLDEVCGPENWKTAYRFIPASQGIEAGVICELSIKVGDAWVTKEDGAEQTDIESFKGGISSALKRAGSAWGIGRYLYQLEGGFAQIVEKGTHGAQWGQTKDKAEFYWVPPRLPDWAVPKGTQRPAALPDVRPGQPGPNDGHQPAPGERGYIVNFGKWNKRPIEHIYQTEGPGSIASYIEYLEGTALKSGKPLGAQALEFIDQASAFLGAMENAPLS